MNAASQHLARLMRPQAEQKPIPVHGGHSGRRSTHGPVDWSHQADFGSIQGMIPIRRAALAQSGYRFSD